MELDSLLVVNERHASTDESECSRRASITIVPEKKRRDRRRERLNTDLLVAVTNGYDPQTVTRLLKEGALARATCRLYRISASHIAAYMGKEEILKALLENGANVKRPDSFGRLPIHLASYNGHVGCLQLLIEYDSSTAETQIKVPSQFETFGDNEDILDSWHHDHEGLNDLIATELVDGSTPLHLACKRVNAKCVECFLSLGVCVDLKDSQGLTPLDVIGTLDPSPPELDSTSLPDLPPPLEEEEDMLHNRSSVASYDSIPVGPRSQPITKSSSFTRPTSRPMLRSSPSFKRGVSLESEPVQPSKPVQKPIHQVTAALLKKGAKLPKVNMKEGTIRNQPMTSVTALHTAVGNEDIDLIKLLLENGACRMTWNDEGDTPLHLAVKKCFVEPLKTLLYHNSTDPVADVRDDRGRTPLHLAVMQEWPEGVNLLLEAGADVNTSSQESETVLHLAAERANGKLLQELLSSGTLKVLEYRDNYHYTPIFRAVESNQVECVQILIDQGADLSASLPGDITLLHVAAAANSLPILELLLKHTDIRALINRRSQEEKGGLTALQIAAQNGYTDCVDLLLLAGSDPALKTFSNEETSSSTAIHLAARFGHADTVQKIISHDSSTLTLKDGRGWYPLHVAAGHGHGKCVKEMLEAGADLSATIPLESGRKSAIDIIINSVSRPILFFEYVFDSYIKKNEYSINDPACEIELTYTILTPNGLNSRQLNVLNALLNSRKQKLQERLLLHPLVETFLHLKWKKLRLFFYILMGFYFLYVISLTAISLMFYVYLTNIPIVTLLLRCALFTSVTPVVIAEILNLSTRQRYYFLDLESWIKWSVFGTGFVVGLSDPSAWYDRYLSSLAVLLAWIELLFFIAKSPSWGFYVLMFSKVATNVCKVLATFAFLLLGFTFAFMIHFEASEPFANMWEAIIKIIVMMNEFDFENTFENHHGLNAVSLFGRGLFGMFVVLVAVSLTNLMVGLAVSDISLLEAQGRTERLAKQISFLNILELVVYNEKLTKCFSKKMKSAICSLRSVPPFIVIKPGKPLDAGYNPLPQPLRESIIERLIEKFEKVV